jgi:hypothetical protein
MKVGCYQQLGRCYWGWVEERFQLSGEVGMQTVDNQNGENQVSEVAGWKEKVVQLI